LHTSPGCAMANVNQVQTGTLIFPDCNSADHANGNQGCGVSNPSPNAYGQAFNNVKGGVYATEWTNQFINVWFFERSAIPADIKSGTPNPSGWGKPFANFPLGDNCNSNKFKDMQIIINQAFCGDWAGKTYGTLYFSPPEQFLKAIQQVMTAGQSLAHKIVRHLFKTIHKHSRKPSGFIII
jgi:hypothetical protein